MGLVQIKYILIQPEGNRLSRNNEAAAGTWVAAPCALYDGAGTRRSNPAYFTLASAPLPAQASAEPYGDGNQGTRTPKRLISHSF